MLQIKLLVHGQELFQSTDLITFNEDVLPLSKAIIYVLQWGQVSLTSILMVSDHVFSPLHSWRDNIQVNYIGPKAIFLK